MFETTGDVHGVLGSYSVVLTVVCMYVYVCVCAVCSEWCSNIHRDSLSSFVGRHATLSFMALAEGTRHELRIYTKALMKEREREREEVVTPRCRALRSA